VAWGTGRLPLVYVHPSWANGRITPDSILARCGLWVVDYHDSPEIPLAWATSGWRLWQYASDNYAGRRAHGHTRIVQGLDRCDRNLFNGDVAGLYRFWNAACPYHLSHPGVLVVESTEERDRHDWSYRLHGSAKRRILGKGKMGAPPIVIGSIGFQDSSQVVLTQD